MLASFALLFHTRVLEKEMLRINHPLVTAYYMKEGLRQLWNQPERENVNWFLCDWIARTLASTIAMLQQFAKTLAVHRHKMPYYDYSISPGPIEGTNNKIQTLQAEKLCATRNEVRK